VRVAARHPDSARIELRAIGLGRVTAVPADVRDQSSVAAAIAGADAVVNTVSAYVEKNGVTFEAVHVQAATAPLASVWLPSESIAPAPTLLANGLPRSAWREGASDISAAVRQGGFMRTRPNSAVLPPMPPAAPCEKPSVPRSGVHGQVRGIR
jgi:hypothetical protein